MAFSHLVIPNELEQLERFSTLLVNPTTKQRVLFEGTPEDRQYFPHLLIQIGTRVLPQPHIPGIGEFQQNGDRRLSPISLFLYP